LQAKIVYLSGTRPEKPADAKIQMNNKRVREYNHKCKFFGNRVTSLIDILRLSIEYFIFFLFSSVFMQSEKIIIVPESASEWTEGRQVVFSNIREYKIYISISNCYQNNQQAVTNS